MKLSFNKVENTSRRVLNFFKSEKKVLEKYPLLAMQGDYFEELYKAYLQDKTQKHLKILLKELSKIHMYFFINSKKNKEHGNYLIGKFMKCTNIFEKKPYSTIFGNTIKEEIILAELEREKTLDKGLKNN